MKKQWPNICEEVNKREHITKFNRAIQNFEVGSILKDVSKESFDFCSRASKLKNFPRNDYGIVCELTAFFLGADIQNFRFHQSRACHKARFLADAIYTLTLYMTQDIHTIMTKQEKLKMKEASTFITICYMSWFLRSFVSVNAPVNDLLAKLIKTSYVIRKMNGKVGQPLLQRFGRHTWY